MFQQIFFFKKDLLRILGKSKIRILHIWMSRVFWGILLYRFERGLFLSLGNYYGIFRVGLLPIFNLIQAYSNLEIHYKADIGPGILVLHPSVGVVISGLSVIGSNLTLTGGNIIGAKAKCKPGEIQIGNNCTLGANAVILGPIKIGNDIKVGASALVIKDCIVNNSILIGVPASVINTKKID